MTKKYEIDEDIEMNEELTEDEEKERDEAITRLYEDDILGGLLAASSYKDETRRIEIVRKGSVVLSFRVCALTEEEYGYIRDKSTKYERDSQGRRINKGLDVPVWRGRVIYNATIEEDRAKIWDNKQAWKKFNVLNGADLVSAVLRNGEKIRIVEVVDELSGFTLRKDEIAKN